MNILTSKSLVAAVGKSISFYLTPSGIILAGRLNRENDLREKNEPVLSIFKSFRSLCLNMFQIKGKRKIMTKKLKSVQKSI